jgi:hypothetical protein
MKKLFLILLTFFIAFSSLAQSTDEASIRKIFDEALARGHSYKMLEQLTKQVGPRLSGSPGAAAAVEWSRRVMTAYGFDSVWLQPVMVPHWERGTPESAKIVNSKKIGSVDVHVCTLGGSVGTGSTGLVSGIIEVKSFDELKSLGEKNVRGKIIFFNRPMDPTRLNTFAAYGGAVDQRGAGAVEAGRLGAVGVVVRSMGLNAEDYPHTGGMYYANDVTKIPAVAISTTDADLLSSLLREDKDLQFYFKSNAQIFPDAPSFNVIGELKGSEHKDEIIVVGGHLDSWDLAEGAHDDGAGCVQSIEVLRIYKSMGLRPKRTIRAVMFMNEENGLRGGLKYAELAQLNKEKHIAAIESDRGGFTPRGFTIGKTATPAIKQQIQGWKTLLDPYGLSDFSQEGGGADIGPLENQGVVTIGFLPDSQRYFSYHHTREDTFEKVDKRELEMGAASMAALVYLIDKYGLNVKN